MSRVNLAEALPASAKASKKAAPRKAAPRKAPAPQASPEEVKAASAPREPQVLGVESRDAKRVSLYLHPDDYEFLRFDFRGGDLQSVFRSLVACVRADDRLRTKVERLSRETPRGRGDS